MSGGSLLAHPLASRWGGENTRSGLREPLQQLAGEPTERAVGHHEDDLARFGVPGDSLDQRIDGLGIVSVLSALGDGGGEGLGIESLALGNRAAPLWRSDHDPV